MSNYFLHKTRLVTAIDDLNIDDATDTYEFVPGFPVDVTRVAFLVTTAVANASGVVDVDLIKRPTAGSSSDQVTLDTFQLTGTTTLAAGSVPFRDLAINDEDGETAEDGTTRYVSPAGPIELDLGQSLLFDVSDAADSGAGILIIEYVEKPFVVSNSRAMKDVT